MLNKVFLIGNLTRDPDVKYLPSGMACTEFGLAVNRKFKSREGEQREEVLFIEISTFGRTAEVMGEYLKKGKKVLVEGRLRLETWDSRDGSGKRSKITVNADNVQFLDSRQGGEEGGGGGGGYPQRQNQQGGGRPAPSAAPPAQAQPPYDNQPGPEPADYDPGPQDAPSGGAEDDLPF